MSPAERRARLYTEKDRPRVEQFEKDSDEVRKWLRVAFHLNGQEIPEGDFDDYIDSVFAEYDDVFMIYDRHPKFESGRGPVGMVCARVRGINREPHAEWFPWASDRNILRSAVSFFMWFRRKGKGNMIVFALNDAKRFYDRLGSYVPLFYAGKIPNGDPNGRGDEHRYYIQGRGK